MHYRLPSPIFGASPPGTRCSADRQTVRGWNGETEQVVDVFPEKTLHEQEPGNVNVCE